MNDWPPTNEDCQIYSPEESDGRRFGDWQTGLFLVTCLASTAAGLGMALWTLNLTWLWLCLPIAIFLS